MCDFLVHRTHLYKPRLSSILSLAHHHQHQQQQQQATSSNHLLAVLRSDHSIELWNTHDSFTLERTIQPRNASHSPELVLWLERYLISAGLDGQLIAYDPLTFEIRTSCHVTGGAIWSLAKHESTRRLAVGTETGHVNIYQLDEVDYSCDHSSNRFDCLIDDGVCSSLSRMPVNFRWPHPCVNNRHVSFHWLGIRTTMIFSLPEVSIESTFVRHDRNVPFNKSTSANHRTDVDIKTRLSGVWLLQMTIPFSVAIHRVEHACGMLSMVH
jgi:WD40 repeat protein